MPDLPQDPRQLARDILAGKISIEDLAREQARRRAGQAPAPPRPMNRPTGSPATVPPGQSPLAAPPARSTPPMVTTPPSRPMTTVRPAPVPPPRRPVPMQPRGPIIQPPRQVARDTRRPAPQVPVKTRGMPRPDASAPAPTTSRIARAEPIGAALRSPADLRRAIILAEILGPPLGLR